MNRSDHKAAAVCLALAVLTTICTGCCSKAAQNNIEPTVEITEGYTDERVFTEPAEPDETPAQKAVSAYSELLDLYPTILHSDVAELEDLSFGYEDNLVKFGVHYDYFAVTDLNNDGISELITTTVINNSWTPVSIFQYDEAADQPKLLKDPLDPEAHETFEQMSTAGGKYSLYICKDNHLHSCWGGDTPIGFQEENHAYVLSNDGLTAVDCAISCHTGNAADIAVNFFDILKINDEASRASISGMWE